MYLCIPPYTYGSSSFLLRCIYSFRIHYCYFEIYRLGCNIIIPHNTLHLQYGCSMKKALHDIEEVSLFKTTDGILSDELSIDVILDHVNRGLKGDFGTSNQVAIGLRKLHQWISRYIDEGATEQLYGDLNADLQHIRYSKSVSSNYSPSKDGNSKGKYIADLTKGITSEEYAAKEFSRIITDRLINSLKRCRGFDCESVFFGPPQAKWCSKTCGSKYRVREKRKRDSS